MSPGKWFHWKIVFFSVSSRFLAQGCVHFRVSSSFMFISCQGISLIHTIGFTDFLSFKSVQFLAFSSFLLSPEICAILSPSVFKISLSFCVSIISFSSGITGLCDGSCSILFFLLYYIPAGSQRTGTCRFFQIFTLFFPS